MTNPGLFEELREWSYIKLSEIPACLYGDAEPIDPAGITWVDDGHNVAIDPLYASYDPDTKEIVYVIDGRRRLAAIATERGDAETLVHVYLTPYMGPEEKVRRVNLNDRGRSEIRAIVFALVRQFGYERTARMLTTSEVEVSNMADGYIREVGTAHAFS